MEITKFLGLRNTVAPERMKPGQLDDALDVDIDDSFALLSRAGQTSLSATASHSLWAKGDTCLVVQDTDLKRMDVSGNLTQLRRLSTAAPVSYVELNGVVYFTNGTDTGRIVAGESKEWGIRRPTSQPRALPIPGDLPPGTYMFAVTFVRSDGLESGSQPPEAIELTEAGGIEFRHLPSSSDPDVVGLGLYLSGPNGETLFRHHFVPSSAVVAEAREFRMGPEWSSGMAEPAPAGTALEVHAGSAYVAQGSVVWVSDQYSLERFRRATRFMQFPGPVAMLGSVTDGMYVATDAATWYLAGNDPMALKSTQVLTYGALPGTMVKFDLEQEGDEDAGPQPTQVALLWTSPNGVIMGGPGGQVRNLTEEAYSMPSGTRGAGLFRVARGYASYIASIQAAGSAANAH